MAESDWAFLSGGLSSGSVARGATAGITPPNGGGSFIFGFNTLSTTVGNVGLIATQASFAPMAKGGSVRGAIKRGISGGNTGFAPMLFIGMGGVTVGDNAYMLGLEDNDPHRIVLRKGLFSAGLPSSPVTIPPTAGVLRASTATYAADTWLHLRLDMVVNLNGDVVLNTYQNDLVANAVSAPVWTAIPGMAQFIDDSLAVNTGTAPLTSGYCGFGIQTSNVTRRMYFDQLEVFRQT